MRSYGFGLRIAVEVVTGVVTTGVFVLASRSSNSGAAWILISACMVLVLVAVLAGYHEPLAKRVWIHPSVIMSLELIALPAAYFTCRGFECAGVIAFLILASFFVGVLIVFSYIGFALKRRVLAGSRATPSPQ